MHLLPHFGYVAIGISGNTGCVAIVTIATSTMVAYTMGSTLHGIATTLLGVAIGENLLQH